MHKHTVRYGYYKGNSIPGDIHPHLSGQKNLEFEFDKKLSPITEGQNKQTVENIIKQKDPEAHNIYDDMELRYLGDTNNEKSKKEGKTKSEKSIFNPLWAFPFKLIWKIFTFWIKFK